MTFEHQRCIRFDSGRGKEYAKQRQWHEQCLGGGKKFFWQEGDKTIMARSISGVMDSFSGTK